MLTPSIFDYTLMGYSSLAYSFEDIVSHIGGIGASENSYQFLPLSGDCQRTAYGLVTVTPWAFMVLMARLTFSKS